MDEKSTRISDFKSSSMDFIDKLLMFRKKAREAKRSITESALKAVGQPLLRSFGATGAALQGLPRQIGQAIRGEDAPI